MMGSDAINANGADNAAGLIYSATSDFGPYVGGRKAFSKVEHFTQSSQRVVVFFGKKV